MFKGKNKVKFLVKNQDESKLIQNLLFKLGYSWRGTGETEYKELPYKIYSDFCIIVYTDKEIVHAGSSYFDCNKDAATIGTIPMLRDEVILQSSSNNDLISNQDTNLNDVINNHIDMKLSYIKKWLQGDKIQYKISTNPDDDKQWHNFTNGAFQYLKRNDICFRESPKYVSLNGIEFKTMKQLTSYVESNYDMK